MSNPILAAMNAKNKAFHTLDRRGYRATDARFKEAAAKPDGEGWIRVSAPDGSEYWKNKITGKSVKITE